jgi:excisionase family DNA binding protein
VKITEAAFLQNKSCDNCNQQKVWLDTKEAAQYLKVSQASLRNRVSLGKIPYFKFGRRNRYLRSDLDNLLFSNRGFFYDDTF